MPTSKVTCVKYGAGVHHVGSALKHKRVKAVVQMENSMLTIYFPWLILNKVLQHGTIILRDYSMVGYSQSVPFVIKRKVKRKIKKDVWVN